MNDREARDHLVEQLRHFLVGPYGGANESVHGGAVRKKGDKIFREISQTPYDFYHTGFISPPDTEIDEEEDDQEEQGSEVDQGVGEGIMVLANSAQQSAMGMTFQVQNPDIELCLTANWGRYELKEIPISVKVGQEDDEPVEKNSSQWKETGELVWQRSPCTVQLTFCPAEVGTGRSVSSLEEGGGQLQARLREIDGTWFISATFINRNRFPDKSRRESDVRLYQASITAQSSDNEPWFIASPNTARRPDSDVWQQELLYREVRQYAVGHGCSVDWEEVGDIGRAHKIVTEWIPQCEVFKASADVIPDSDFLELDRLAEPGDAGLQDLRKLVTEYGTWIESREASIDSIVQQFPDSASEHIREAAQQNLKDCRLQCARIEAGIDYLEQNSVAYEAFCLANRAITISMKKSRPDRAPKWFPFQLAFILIALPSLSNRKHVDRDVLDLIWFPTGGGKTEAYLGLSAYTLFYRGLTAESEIAASGTAIITRYTLRTLTVQQFERTCLAIMCCEKVRREHPELTSHRPWTTGLLVGSASTPKWISRKNPNDGSAEDYLQRGGEEARGALLPLKKCPWCGTSLDLNNLRLLKDDNALLTFCGNNSCDFHDSIPIRIIDEHLMADPPSFVVSTIDKFAQIAWEPDLAKMLGCGTQANPPDMIIQDELHLITDSLGTIAGLYEIAIDALASHQGSGPKIIGATATIKRAEEQVKSLFLRKTRQFPPSGVDASDSFFYAEDTESPGRCYVGVHAQGRSPKHTLPRVIGTLAQSATEIEPLSVRDAYWTIVSYFNSLRELGGALVIAEDDVTAYQKSLSEVTGSVYRPLGQKSEMTSQVPSHQIPERLDQLKIGLESDGLDMEPVDLLFATSMISVGVDVDRLGLMLIAGQPKTTAEYIQASSRVGRPAGSAGLVIIQYNWTRPRDRSHYERFIAYHKSFYRFVEAVSVTPFSPRARDKALRGVVASMLRTMVPELRENEIDHPAEISNVARDRINEIRDIIRSRVNAIDSRESEDTLDHLDGILESFQDFLEDPNEAGKFWIRWRVGKEARQRADFMLSSSIGAEEDSPWEAMLSMRDTDAPATLRLYLGRSEE